jgi:hypothetical protein
MIKTEKQPLMKPNYLIIPAHLAAAYLVSGDWTMVQFLDWYATNEDKTAKDAFQEGYDTGYNDAMNYTMGE